MTKIISLILLTLLLITVGIVFIKSHSLSIVQAACTVGNQAEGLISANSAVVGQFGNANGVCIQDPKAAYAPFEIPSYDELKAQFYTSKRLTTELNSTNMSSTNNLAPNTFNTKGNGVYNVNLPSYSNSLTINSGSVGVSGVTDHGIAGQDETEVIFVDSNLSITSNIVYHTSDAKGGLVFIVKGNIYIGSSVTQIDAVLISESNICTRVTNFGTNPIVCDTKNTAPKTSALTVNGSLISLNKQVGVVPITFGRNLADNTQPSETVIEQGKYLLILKDLFTQPIKITSELN